MTTRAHKLALFVDLETTGLDPILDQILEAAFVLVDTDTWTTLHERTGLLYTEQTKYKIENNAISEYVLNMHKKSGLWDELMEVHENYKKSGEPIPTYKDYQTSMIEYLESIGITRSYPSWGSSVHFDRKFLSSKMPGLNEFMHYRIVDSSSDMERLKLRYPALWKKIDEDPTKLTTGTDHRALDDIRHSIDLERRLDKWVCRPAASIADIGNAQ